jgi:serine/threonine protein kinase
VTSREGEQLGNYRLVRLLGQGGFAEVYLGEHVHIRKQAAIKVLHTRLAETAITVFQREAQIIADLRHPHIVNIFDFALQDNLPFLVMDYCAEGSLRRRYPHGTRMPMETLIEYVDQLADALYYAHEKRVIHRDVKPENMLIGSRGEIILSDFGIAAIAHSTTSIRPEAFAGTPYYVAPEQISEHPVPASDQYALAIVVYEWLTGSLPFQGTLTEVFAKQLMIQAPSLREKVPDLKPEVEHVVLTALSKDPRQRFSNIKAFATALAAAAYPYTSFASPAWYEQRDDDREKYREENQAIPLANSRSIEHVEPALRKEPTPPPIRVEGSSKLTPVFNSMTPVAPGPEITTPSQIKKTRKETGRLQAIAGLLLSLIVVGGLMFFAGNKFEQIQAIKQATTTAGVTHQATATGNDQSIETTTAANTLPYPKYLPGKGQFVFYDPMKPADSWEQDINQQHTGLCTISGGAYHTTMGAQGYRWCIDNAASMLNFSDFAYQIQMKILKGDCGGILFRANQEVTYMFTICQWGEQLLYKHTPASDQFYLLAGGKKGAQVHTGFNQNNLIAVVAQGSSLSLFINGQQVDQIQDSSSNHGDIGVAAVDENNGTDVIFSDAAVWAL